MDKMSVYSSGRKSFVSHRSSLAKAKKVENFKFTSDLKKLIQNFVNQKEQKRYEELVVHMRDSGLEIKDKDLIMLLKEARSCISLLDRNCHLFVKVLLIQKWPFRGVELVEEYQGFLLELCSAHSFYTELAINQLTKLFLPDAVEDPEWINGQPTEEDRLAFSRVHDVLKILLRVIPMSSELFFSSLTKNFPYHGNGAHVHECYVYNLLTILQYQSSMRRDILNLIISRLVTLDTHAPKREIEEMEARNKMEEDMFAMDDAEAIKSSKHELAHTLDVCMEMLFRFFENELHDSNKVLIWDKAKAAYLDLINIFDSVILPTFALNHVQFLLFRFVSMKSTLYNLFLQHLWKKVLNVNTSVVIRQSAVAYMASLLSRTTYIPLVTLKEVLSNFASWIHGYISAEDSQENCNQSKRVHCVFYSICQALFYVIAFRHRDFAQTKKDLMFLQGLNLSKIATCKLNPLRVCLPQVVSNFASITRTYQLAYCYSIIEHNSRNSIPVVERDEAGLTTQLDEVYLDMFFPFDPYLLPRSKKYIDPLYRAYDGPSAEEVSYSRHKDDDDDFLMECSSPSTTMPSFSYGTSPGFHL
ncbi:RNA polymerase I-specific transcription initiation factor RRN3 [Nilaparvata lugens]|uniref:RNA polymerase I-specific transcription initiation factor RRN3 n=1 Tax=Nilaparvata lugens TaxID=108931 RepID=UPI000B980A47|nr:RNA polymerase I-specific transcription initiation factor RRN3 [Nilaparvata lugens]